MTTNTIERPFADVLDSIKDKSMAINEKQLHFADEISQIIDDITELFNAYALHKNPLCFKDGKTETFELFCIGHVSASLHYEPELETFSSMTSVMPLIGKIVIKFGQEGKKIGIWEKPLAMDTAHNDEVFSDFIDEVKALCELTYEYVPVQKALIQARKKLHQKTLLQVKAHKADVAKKLGC